MLIPLKAVYAGSVHTTLIRSRAQRRPERERADRRVYVRAEPFRRSRTPLVARPGSAQEELYG
jgi:hypothetical protein